MPVEQRGQKQSCDVLIARRCIDYLLHTRARKWDSRVNLHVLTKKVMMEVFLAEEGLARWLRAAAGELMANIRVSLLLIQTGIRRALILK